MELNAEDAATLLELYNRAMGKMLSKQREDHCSVAAEFETLILFVGDLLGDNHAAEEMSGGLIFRAEPYSPSRERAARYRRANR